MTWLSDKRLITAGLASAVVWLASLVMIWGWVLDASGLTTLVTVLAALLAVATAARWSRPAALAVTKLLSLFRRPMAQSLAPALGRADRAQRVGGPALLELLAAAGGMILVGGLISTAAALLCPPLIDRAATWFGWTPLAWALLQAFVQWLTLLPIAVGISAWVGVAAIIRRDSRLNRLATLFREGLVAVAIGWIVFAVAWGIGVHLLLLAGLAAVGLLVVTWLAGSVAQLTTPSRGFKPGEPDRAGWAPRARIFGTFAAVAVILVTQMRMLGDLVGLSMMSRIVWAAATLVLLARVLEKMDRRRLHISLTESAAALLGIVFAVALQVALGFVALSMVPGGLAIAVAAAAVQWPLIILAGRLISRQRRLFVDAGGATSQLLSLSAGGAAVGLSVYVVAGLIGADWLMPGLLAALGVGAVIAGARTVRGRRAKTIWAVATLVLLICAGGVVQAAVAGDDHGRPARGVWLRTLLSAEGGPHRIDGALPTAQPWRSQAVTEVMHNLLGPPGQLGHHRGRWWVVVSSLRDSPVVTGVYAAPSMPDTTTLSPAQASGLVLLGAEGPYLLAAMIGTERFDGVLLAPLPADHPEAWRCYNLRTLKRCYRRVLQERWAVEGEGAGAMVLRTQVRFDRLHDAFEVVRTFLDVVGDAWAVVDLQDDRVDILVAGPKARGDRAVVRQPAPVGEAIVVSAEDLWMPGTTVRPIRLLRPRGLWRPSPPQRHIWVYHLLRAARRLPPRQPAEEDPQFVGP